ncbi:hypothetical protein RGQ29_014279 [Quercus rubra]|uniref:NB-ARC domain-containing protein n=1 Tax=Quercus rubra TaxID=3512 RepID=A0AAN7FV13_QUERU|nr:hypothetical protein RGQ29_014279 [Quercus rubra]
MARLFVSLYLQGCNIENMKKKVEELETRKEEQNAIDASGGNCEEIKQYVKRWLAEVNKIMGKAKDLVIEDDKRATTTGSYWTLLNLKLRHQQSKKAKKIVEDIDEVLKNSRFESRMLTMKRLMVALKDENINLVGVWGMAGVGKTTLVREVAKQVKEEKLFDEVVIATVTQSPDLIRIQGEIADKLDLKLDKETLSGRADLLRARNRDILSCEMGTQKDFVLNVLPQEEAWSLFEKMVGDSLKDQNLQSIATEVSKECAGLPLALVTVAKALKNKNETEWKDALQQLRQPSSNNRKKMQEVIYSSIQFSYDNLENPGVTKSFFLLCGHEMNPGIDYTDLLKYCFRLQLFRGISTLEETRIKMGILIQSLKDSCLLLDGPHNRQYVLMHDLVRDAAIFIASKAQTVLTMRSDSTVKWPGEVNMRMYTAISVHAMSIKEIPDTLECPNLRFFVNWETTIIGELKNLEILSLFKSELTELLREIGLLTRLRLLDLRNCTKLKLEELYVSKSFTQWEIQGVNNERASLAELKHLSQLTTIEVHIPDANMLPKDLVFKNLKIYKISIGDVWDWTDKHENSRAITLKLSTSFQLESGIKMWLNGIEYLCLDKLKGVESVIYELDVKGFQQLKHLHVQNNAEIKYIVNSRELAIADVVFPALEIFSLKNVIELEEICCGQLPLTSSSNLTIVKVEQCDKAKFVFSLSIAKGLSQLQELEIRECNILGAIIIKEEGGIEDRYMILFPRLRDLVLHRLPKLMSFLSASIINDAEEISPECDHDFNIPVLQEQVAFTSLETLEISHMENLKIIWHNQLAEDSFLKFQSLERLDVYDCGSLQEVFEIQRHDVRDTHVVTSLNILFPASVARFLIQLEDLRVVECGLEDIVALEDGAEAVARLVFPKVTLLMLKNLPKLKWFSRRLRTLEWPLLKVLEVIDYDQTEIISSRILNIHETIEQSQLETFSSKHPFFLVEEGTFPNLEELSLGGNYMKEIEHGQVLEDFFYKLKILYVIGHLPASNWINFLQRSNNLEKFVASKSSWGEIFPYEELFGNEEHARILTQLRELELFDLPLLTHLCGKLTYLGSIWLEGVWLSSISFQNLTNLEIWKYHGLINLITPSTTKNLVKLKKMSVRECERITEVVVGKRGEASEVITFT